MSTPGRVFPTILRFGLSSVVPLGIEAPMTTATGEPATTPVALMLSRHPGLKPKATGVIEAWPSCRSDSQTQVVDRGGDLTDARATAGTPGFRSVVSGGLVATEAAIAATVALFVNAESGEGLAWCTEAMRVGRPCW